MPGSYVFKPIEANLIRDTDLLGKMNPYCNFYLVDNKRMSTQACMKGGKNPTWTDSLIVTSSKLPSHEMRFEIMDKSRILSDGTIGSGIINLDELGCSGGESKKRYPIYYDNKPVGDVLMQVSFKEGIDTMETRMEVEGMTGKFMEECSTRKVFTEQHEVVEPHTFTKNVEVVETIPVKKEIEVMEPVKVMRDVEYTEAVPVKKTIEVVEPKVVKKQIDAIEPRVVTKTIQVIENVPVKRDIEVVEMVHTTKEVETMEPRSFHKRVEVTEQVPKMKTVTVSEPVTVTRSVEFVEPIITTQIITKEIMEPVVVSEKTTISVGPETIVKTELEGKNKSTLKTQYQEKKEDRFGVTEQISGMKTGWETKDQDKKKDLFEVTEQISGMKTALDQEKKKGLFGMTEQVSGMKTGWETKDQGKKKDLFEVTGEVPVTMKKDLKFVEPAITTQTVTKKTMQPIVTNEKTTISAGSETIVGTELEGKNKKISKTQHQDKKKDL